MREHPIIFSGPMVRAILEGRKSQTRRTAKPQPSAGVRDSVFVRSGLEDGHGRELRCPYGQPGDRLWVRETHLLDPPIDGSWPSVGDGFASIEDIPGRYRNTKHVLYRADNNLSGDWCWRPSIHMPRWASRITLEITDVRVQRVQDISEEDAIAEGCAARPFPGPWWQGYRDIDGDLIHQEAVGEFPPDWMIEPHRMRDLSHLDVSARDAFHNLWDSINEKRGFGWNANPWVWALTFKRVEE